MVNRLLNDAANLVPPTIIEIMKNNVEKSYHSYTGDVGHVAYKQGHIQTFRPRVEHRKPRAEKVSCEKNS